MAIELIENFPLTKQQQDNIQKQLDLDIEFLIKDILGENR